MKKEWPILCEQKTVILTDPQVAQVYRQWTGNAPLTDTNLLWTLLQKAQNIYCQKSCTQECQAKQQGIQPVRNEILLYAKLDLTSSKG